jgi:hypothetical protein
VRDLGPAGKGVTDEGVRRGAAGFLLYLPFGDVNMPPTWLLLAAPLALVLATAALTALPPASPPTNR